MEESSGFLDFASSVPDPRSPRNVLHPVGEILLLTLSAMIRGADSWNDIELYGKHKVDFLRDFLPFENGIPSDDTLRRFFRALDSNRFSEVFAEWARSLPFRKERGGIALDGKTARGSIDREAKALHMVSAFASEVGLVLGQTKTEEKRNEITAIPE